jgi:hypothetical protein
MTRAELPRPDHRLAIGNRLDVSPFCLGMVDDSDAVLAAYDAGINFFFVTADMHWPVYGPLREGLAKLLARGGDIRSRIVIAGASYIVFPEFSEAPYEELIESIPGVGTLDVLVAGGMYTQDLERRIPTLQRHREQRFLGARAIAATFHDRPALVPFARDGTLDLCFVRFNAAFLGARTEVFPHVTDRKVPLFNFKSTLGYVSDARCDELDLPADYWRPDITDHYRFVLSHDAIDGVLCSLTTPAHVAELVEALELGPLDDDEQEHLVQLKVLDHSKAV